MNIPNCVPEYYRSMFEDEAHESYLEMQRQERYKANAKYINNKIIEGWDEITFYPIECEGCSYGEDKPITSELDDIPSKLCSNWKTCPVFKENVREAFPDITFDEYIGWHDEHVENLKARED